MTDIYDVSGDSVTAIYDISGNVIHVEDFPDPNLLSVAEFSRLFKSTNTGQTQGSCIDDDGNIYTIHNTTGKITKYNIYTKTETVYNFTANAYGHANDATYNPNTGYIYVVSMNNTGEVYVLDPENNMELVDTVYAVNEYNVAYAPWNIAYNRTLERFVLLAVDTIYLYNDDFILTDSSQNYDPTTWTQTGQGMETDGKYIYGVSYNPNVFHVWDYNGTFIMNIDASALNGEPETLIYDWNTGCYFVQQMKSGADIYFVKMQQFYTKDEIDAFEQMI